MCTIASTTQHEAYSYVRERSVRANGDHAAQQARVSMSCMCASESADATAKATRNVCVHASESEETMRDAHP